jgi:hypothetical protein
LKTVFALAKEPDAVAGYFYPDLWLLNVRIEITVSVETLYGVGAAFLSTNTDPFPGAV